MEIGAVTSQTGYFLQVEAPKEEDSGILQSPENPAPQPQAVEDEPDISEPVEQESEGGEKAKGVLRNLQAGHFKGVADVRLRINFYEELSAIERQRLQEVTEEKVGSILENVATALESGGFTEDQLANVEQFQKEFFNAVTELKDEFTANDEPDKEGLIAGLESRFESLIEPLSTALVAAIGETPGENDPIPEEEAAETGVLVSPLAENEKAAPETSSVSEVESDFQTFIENVRATFEVALEQLATGLNEVDVLPELSEPTGKGVAYQKFAALYNEVWNIDNRQGVLDGGEQFSEIA